MSRLEGREWTTHHRLLTAIVQGQPGVTSETVHDLYEALAPLVYYGTTEESVSESWRHDLLAELEEAGVVISHDQTEGRVGRVWVPAGVESKSIRVPARLADGEQA
jgi:hypothetical protein